MKRIEIPFDKFTCSVVDLLKARWMLLTAGENKPGAFNMMTIGWASFGVMWDRPFAAVVVRPSRYTYEFLEKGRDFTLCAFPEAYRDKLRYCGSKSGRRVDKVRESGLTAIPSARVKSPAWDEADLIVECRKIYYDDFKPANFLADNIEGFYKGSDYHRTYFGEIVAIQGVSSYRCA